MTTTTPLTGAPTGIAQRDTATTTKEAVLTTVTGIQATVTSSATGSPNIVSLQSPKRYLTNVVS